MKIWPRHRQHPKASKAPEAAKSRIINDKTDLTFTKRGTANKVEFCSAFDKLHTHTCTQASNVLSFVPTEFNARPVALLTHGIKENSWFLGEQLKVKGRESDNPLGY